MSKLLQWLHNGFNFSMARIRRCVLLGQQWPPGFAAEKGSTNHFGCLETLKDANSRIMSAEKSRNQGCKLYSCQIQSDFRTEMYGNALQT